MSLLMIMTIVTLKMLVMTIDVYFERILKYVCRV